MTGVMAGSGSSGRTQLKGVLENLVQQTRDEQEYVEVEDFDEEVEECARHLLEYSSPRKKLKLDGSHRRKRKRVPKDSGPDGAYDEDRDMMDDASSSETVSIYGRQVNLSRLSSDPSLYSLCREWVCSRTREPPWIANHSSVVNQDSLQCLPVPTAPPSADGSSSGMEVDQSKINTTAIDNALISDSVNDDMQDLKQRNIEKWKLSRKRCNQASMKDWQRYAASWAKLQELCQQ